MEISADLVAVQPTLSSSTTDSLSTGFLLEQIEKLRKTCASLQQQNTSLQEVPHISPSSLFPGRKLLASLAVYCDPRYSRMLFDPIPIFLMSLSIKCYFAVQTLPA